MFYSTLLPFRMWCKSTNEYLETSKLGKTLVKCEVCFSGIVKDSWHTSLMVLKIDTLRNESQWFCSDSLRFLYRFINTILGVK